MNTTETIEQTDIAPWDPDEPMMAHHSRRRFYPNGDPYTALCGARLLGVKAPPNWEPICETCHELGLKLLFGRIP